MTSSPSESEVCEVLKIVVEVTAAKQLTKELSKYERWLDVVCEKLLSHLRGGRANSDSQLSGATGA